jgi:hypothetical protein
MIGVIVLVLIGGAFAVMRNRERSSSSPGGGGLLRIGGRGQTLEQANSRYRGFDLAYALPGSPEGIATNGKELIIGNRRDPWGLLRVRQGSGKELRAEHIPLIEPRYQQKMNVSSLTWNGENYIGYTSAAWFQEKGQAFTIHDPKSLRIVGWKNAPDLLGCIAWDGSAYWAATRRNTADSPEPALLYKLDKGFNIISRSDSPSAGCQGLAWDGRYLWMADVFSDTISVIDPAGGTPRLVHKAPTELSYLSGVVVFDNDVWVVDYGDNLLQRIAPDTRVAWAAGSPAATGSFVAASAVPASSSTDIVALQRQLRSDQWSDRMRAEMELGRLNAPIDFDRDENRFIDRKPDDTEMIDWSVELRDGAVHGSWKIWFGHDLFVRNQAGSSIVSLPQFAKYRVTTHLPGGEKIEREFDAVAGDNVMREVRLADANVSGEYSVDIFLHVQYTRRDGQGQILNRSGSSLRLRR